MSDRRWRVRRFFGHSDRLVALPDDGSQSHDRRDPEYDSYDRPKPSAEASEQQSLPVVQVSAAEKRACPACSRQVRYNLTRGYYYSHTLPDLAETCPHSGRP